MARILVVDDERHIVRLAQVNLERAGHSVIALTDSAQVMATLRRERPDLVVLDTRMPPPDGFELVRQIAVDPVLREIQLILLTPRCADPTPWFEEELPALQRAGCTYLVKPFNPADLLVLTGRLLSGMTGVPC